MRFCSEGPLDEAERARAIGAALQGCGLSNPDVTLERVPALSRQVSGKLKRFVPLSPRASAR